MTRFSIHILIVVALNAIVNLPSYGQPLVTNDGLALTVDSGLTLSIEGAFTNQTDDDSLGTIDNAGIITLTGNWSNNSANTVFRTNNGTVQFIGTTDTQTIGGTYGTGFYDVTMSGVSTKLLTRDMSISNNLMLNAGIFDVDSIGNYHITIGGNWTNTGGTFKARNGTVTFNGTSAQTIASNGQRFYNIILNGTGSMTLNGNAIVDGVCTLIEGVLTTGTVDTLIIFNTNAASLTGYSDSSFINGNLRRYITTNSSTYAFPVGNGTATTNYYRADIINNNLTGISYIDSRFEPLTGHVDKELIAVDTWEHGSLTYTSINPAGVWVLEPDAPRASGSYDVKLYIANMSGLVDNEFGPLKRPVGSTSGADWTTGIGTLNNDDSPGRTVASGYMQRNGLTSFSEHGAGSGSETGGGLPIELLDFSATVEDDIVEITWVTATEINNDYFTVERSGDGINFEVLGFFAGAGNSSETKAYGTVDHYPLKGASYYRLKQTDFDGASCYSDIESVYIGPDNARQTITLSPNPLISDNKIFLGFSNFSASENIEVSIIDISGRLVYDGNQILTPSKILSITLPEKLQKGLYIVVIKSPSGSWKQKLIVE